MAGLTKHQGQSTHNYRYDAYGQVLPAQGNWMDPHNHYTFAGKEWDEHLGLYEFGFRLYDPWAGVWLTREPLLGWAWEPRTWHRYQYAYASPISYYDPYGEFPILVPIITGIVGGLAAGAGSFIAQVATGQGSFSERWQNVDWGNVAIATGVGAVAGALAPFVATSIGGAIALGATANVVQYTLTQWSNEEPIRLEEMALNAVIGGVVGGIGGLAPSLDKLAIPFARWSPWLDQRVVESIMTERLLKSISFSFLARSIGLQAVNNWPISWPQIIRYWHQIWRLVCE
ncbi:MAG: RHS repeat-associated core domain-containing protein [Candidatus Bathyarchaeia archaeon]